MASKIHRVRFYNPKPQPINCVCLNKSTKLLAVARGDASIEVWDINYAPYLVKFIPGEENGSIEALVWVKDRLLSTGLGGALLEWDLDKLVLKNTVLLTGYAAWCLDVNKDESLVAVGTEQGYVNLYNVEDDDIVYKKLFDKQEGRILCCKFNTTGTTLITGSVNSIRVWNVETGHAITRMSVSRRAKEVIVWCLGVLSDNTVVSGDSLGRLTFWDSNLGDQIESYSTHKADILSLVISDDEKILFCSGVDPVILNFVKVDKNVGDKTEAQWVKNMQRNIHEHDVRGLILHNQTLISIGVDGYLTFTRYPPKWVMRLPPMIPAPRSRISAAKKLLLLKYSNHLEVWKLGSYAIGRKRTVLVDDTAIAPNTPTAENVEQDSTITVIKKAKAAKTKTETLVLTDQPVKMLSLHSKGKKQIQCCEISPHGELIVYSTATDIRALKLESDDEHSTISVSKLLINGIPKGGCDRIAFTQDSSVMVVNCAGVLQVLQVDPEAGIIPLQSILLSKYLKSKSLLHLYISKKCPSSMTYLVIADTLGNIAVWTLGVKKFEYYLTLPTYHCVPSALTVDCRHENLIVTYVDQKIVEYELNERRFSNWPGSALPPAWLSRETAVLSISMHPTRDAVLFQDETSLWIMEKTVQNNDDVEPKVKRKPQGGRNMELEVVPIKYLADFHWLYNDEAVSLEMLPENIVSQLPPVVTNKRNGRA